MNKLYIGWAEESLLPGKKIALAGQFYERVSDEIDTPLLATAMAIEKGSQRAIIVAADIGEVQPFLLNLAREEFARLNQEIAPEQLIFGATQRPRISRTKQARKPATRIAWKEDALSRMNIGPGLRPWT